MIGDVAVHDAGRKGKGVFALRDFRKGEFIFRRRHGKVVTVSQIRSLSAEDRRHLCELDRKKSAVLLPPGCFLNHSCEPNAMRSGVKVFGARSAAVTRSRSRSTSSHSMSLREAHYAGAAPRIRSADAFRQ